MHARCLGLSQIVSVICYCLLIATLNVSSGDSSTEILLCFPLFALLPPVSAVLHPDHMGSPLSAWSSVSCPLVAGYDSQVSPCVYDKPSEGMWELRPDRFEKVPRRMWPVDHGGETTFLSCLPEAWSPGHWVNSSVSTFTVCSLPSVFISLKLLLAVMGDFSSWPCLLCLQVGFPSKTDSPSCEYSRFDFDSDEDFNAFFNCKLPVWMLLSVPSLLLSVAGRAWSLPCWLGSFHLCLDSFSLDLGVKLI